MVVVARTRSLCVIACVWWYVVCVRCIAPEMSVASPAATKERLECKGARIDLW